MKNSISVENNRELYNNIFYMLLYAWERIDLKLLDKINVAKEDYDNFPTFLVWILSNLLSKLIKKGLEKNYDTFVDDLSFSRGKIMIKNTMNNMLRKKLKLNCQYDILNSNTLNNQIIKTTLYLLLKSEYRKSIINKKEIIKNIEILYNYFHDVELIKLNKNTFKKVILHRNNKHYDIVIKICEFIYNNYLIYESDKYDEKIINILDDETKMSTIFEEFVLNYYKTKLKNALVKRENIYWSWSKNILEGDENLIPKMQTDTSIELGNKKIIIDTKYYKKALSKNYDKEKFISSNLYQINSYLTNYILNKKEKLELVGILLYPEVGSEINFCAENKKTIKYKICVKTIDLNKHWTNIEKRLNTLIKI
ncbi:5-methylcytosine restriction system specificity protein McrC [Marinitoga lauensis]|uniref:5-methylcytosine restriction system specificity protein McrC n=1 Tax=Marinitoga lauensis TaxID=2201189 RepID=UPI001011640C|nr:restriction endonuclease [Marinitoga lauensis]